MNEQWDGQPKNKMPLATAFIKWKYPSWLFCVLFFLKYLRQVSYLPILISNESIISHIKHGIKEKLSTFNEKYTSYFTDESQPPGHIYRLLRTNEELYSKMRHPVLKNVENGCEYCQ